MSATPLPNSQHFAFLAILPKIENHAQMYFRYEKCLDRKSDRIAEVIGIAWRWYCRLSERGKDPCRFAVVLANFACRAVKSGRRVCGQEKAKDVMSPRAQHRHGFRVEPLPASTSTSHETLYGTVRGQQLLDTYEERLRDNTQSPVPDQAAFRIDFPTWLTTLSERDRSIVQAMALNYRTKDLARMYGLSEGRVSQKRGQFHDDWCRFCDDAAQA